MANTYVDLYQNFTGSSVSRYPGGPVYNWNFGPRLSRLADVRRPDYPRRRKPEGWLYPTPYSFYKAIRNNPEHVSGYLNTFDNADVRYSGPAQLLSDGDLNAKRLQVTSSMIERAELKALLKFKQSNFNAAVAIGEARACADLLGTTAMRLAQSYRHLRKGRFGQARQALGLAFDKQPTNWLELQYGWKPMLSDVFNATESVKKAAGFGNQVVTVKARVKEETAWDEYINPTHPCNRIRFKGKAEASVFVRLDAEPENDMLIWANSLGLTNPAVVAWELLPFSFVLDWALPIGDWLSALDATLGWKFKSGSRSQRTIMSASGQNHPFDDPGFVYRNPYTNGATSAFSEKSLNRIVYTNFPIPTFPRIKNPLSLGHMANGLSLLAAVFGSRR